MSRTTSHLWRSLLALLVAASSLAAFAGTAAPAGASDGAPTYEVGYGNNGLPHGTATVSRIAGDDHDTLLIDLLVPGGFEESHLCVADTTFTSRIAPGQCQHGVEFGKQGAEAHRYEISVPSGATVYLQLHVVYGNETAYAGWLDGSPHYGNIEVPPVVVIADPVECPEGMAPEDGEIVVDADGEPTNCVWIPVEADCPTGQVPVEGETPMDLDDDGIADEGCETPEDETPVVPVVTCPDGSTPMTDRNGDGVIDGGDCRVTTVAPDGAVPSIPVTTPLAPVTPNVPTAPQEPAAPTAPENPAPFAPVPTVDVLPTEDVVPTGVVPTVVTVDNPQVTEVLGDQVVAGALPRTGAATPGLAALGALLLAAGTVLTRTGRRFA